MPIQPPAGHGQGNTPRPHGPDSNESKSVDQNSDNSVPSPASPARSESGEQVQPVADRVEISREARTRAQDEEARRNRELAFAQKALLGIPPLDEEKIAELQDRIRERYYQKPEVIRDVAEKVARDLEG